MTSAQASRIIPARPERVFGAATRYDAMSDALPDYYAMSRTRSARGNVAVVDAQLVIAGQTWRFLARHTVDPPLRHEIAVIGGDGRGSRLVETYEALDNQTRLTITADIRRRRRLDLRAQISEAKLESWLDGLLEAIGRAALA